MENKGKDMSKWLLVCSVISLGIAAIAGGFLFFGGKEEVLDRDVESTEVMPLVPVEEEELTGLAVGGENTSSAEDKAIEQAELN